MRAHPSGKLSKILALFTVLLVCQSSFAQHPTARELYEQGLSLLRENEPAEALLKLEASVGLDDTDPRPYALIGTIHFTFENFGRSADAFRKAVELRPNDPQVRAGLCRALAADGKVLEGIDECRKAVSIDPESQRANTDLIIVLRLQSSPPSDLRDLIERALSRFPDNIEILVAAARYFERRDTPRSVELYERLASIEPESTHWHMHLAEHYIELERDRDAIDAQSRVRQQGLAQLDVMKARAAADPDDWQIRHNLFTTLGYARRMDEAEIDGEEIRKLNPQVAEAYVSMGVVYYSNGDFQKAEQSHRMALAIREDAGAYLGLAHFYERTDQPEKAIEAYENVIRVKPDVPNIMILYARYLLDLGLRRQALDVFKRSLALQPLNTGALFHAGYLSARPGDTDAAEGYLVTLRSLGSPDAKLL